MEPEKLITAYEALGYIGGDNLILSLQANMLQLEATIDNADTEAAYIFRTFGYKHSDAGDGRKRIASKGWDAGTYKGGV